jgi:hypothetical protein
MAPNLLMPAIALPLMAFAVWRRARSQFGRQPIRRRRMMVRIAVFAVIGVLLAGTGLHSPRLAGGLLAGVLGGALLGLAGLRLTRFERGADGADCYIPHPWIGALLMALLVGRLAWRFAVMEGAMGPAGPGAALATPSGHPVPPPGQSALTLLVVGLMVGYYIVYYAGLLIHHRRFAQAQNLPQG